jgi:DNA-binding IclR family transcriptional regulator
VVQVNTEGAGSYQSPPAATHSLTLDRGLRALYALLGQPDGMSVAELADALDTHRAAIYRLLAPLTEHRVVRRLADGRYVLGAGLIELASGVQSRLQEEADPILRALADQLGATTALTVRDGRDAVVAIVIAPRDQLVHLTYRTGMRHPLSTGAPGLALLAALPQRPGEPAEVAQARERGWARSTGQLLPGATGVAAPILSPANEAVAAISAVWITGVDVERAGRAIANAADALADAIQGRAGPRAAGAGGGRDRASLIVAEDSVS